MGLLGNTERSWPFPIVKHLSHSCWGKMKTSASENLGNLHLAEGGAEYFQTPHGVTDELGKAIDRFGQLDERIRAFLSEDSGRGPTL